MSSQRRPFRLSLNATPDEASLRLLLRIQAEEPNGTTIPDLTETLSTANEVVLFFVATVLKGVRDWHSRGPFPDTWHEWHAFGRVLESRALQLAEEDGVVWTPLLDALAQADIWFHTASPSNGPQYQAERMVPWLEQEATPDDISDLLCFNAPVIRKLVARHAADLTPELVLTIGQTSELVGLLRENPAVGSSLDSEILAQAVEGWRYEIQNWQSLSVTQVEVGNRPRRIAESLLSDGVPLSDESRELLLAELQTGSHYSTDACRFFLADPEAQGDFLRNLHSSAKSMPLNVAALFATHPNFPLDCWADLIADRNFALRTLNASHLSQERFDIVWDLYAAPGKDLDPINLAMASQPAIPPSSIEELLDAAQGHSLGELYRALTRNPGAMALQPARKALRNSGSVEVARALVDTAELHDYEACALKLLRIDPDVLLDHLRVKGPPAPLHSFTQLAAELLSHDRREIRTLAITLMGETGAATPTPDRPLAR